jgi:hypothetical protein
MMQNARENLDGLWRSHKGLVVLLFVGLIISLLAVLAPQAWATPGQRPLMQTTTNVVPEDPVPDCLWVCEDPVRVRTTLTGFNVIAQTVADVYITDNITWTAATTMYNGTMVGTVPVVHQTQVTIGADGHFIPNPVTIWNPPLVPGIYDIFFDVNRDGEFNNDDAVLYPEGRSLTNLYRGAAICVVPCTVGGATLPSKTGIGLRWLALPALVGAGAAAAFVWRRRRS